MATIEEVLKAELEYKNQQKVPNLINDCGSTQGGSALTGQLGYACVPTFKETLENARYHAESSARELARLEELARLLDNNPETARILKLLNLLHF